MTRKKSEREKRREKKWREMKKRERMTNLEHAREQASDYFFDPAPAPIPRESQIVLHAGKCIVCQGTREGCALLTREIAGRRRPFIGAECRRALSGLDALPKAIEKFGELVSHSLNGLASTFKLASDATSDPVRVAALSGQSEGIEIARRMVVKMAEPPKERT